MFVNFTHAKDARQFADRAGRAKNMGGETRGEAKIHVMLGHRKANDGSKIFYDQKRGRADVRHQLDEIA